MIALLFAVRLRRRILHALEKSLVERAIELDPSLVEDSATRSVLMQSVETALPSFAIEARPQGARASAAAGSDCVPAPGGRSSFR